MDILLFNPYYSQTEKYYSYYRPAPPLGLLYLASYLEKNRLCCGVEELGVFTAKEALRIGTKIRFGISDTKIVEILRKERPKILGITCMYSIYFRDVLEIAATVKKEAPDIKIILGGNHASSYWRQVIKNQCVDYIVIGEGEETFLELCNKLINGSDVSKIKGIAFRDENGQAVINKHREFISDLDTIPFPAYNKIDFKRYLSEGNPFAMRFPVVGIVSSRGCPGDCVYCTVKAVWGRTWRGRSSKNVVDEIEYLYNTYSIREIAFLDDSASVDRKRWEDICEEIIRRKLDIKWTTPNGIAHWTLSNDLLNKMQMAGCYRITFGIESGDPETRKFLGKPYSLAQAKGLINHANRIGMWSNCTNIIGFPYEKLGSIKKTISFAKECGTDFACFFLLIPQPTSKVYQYFKHEGLLNFDAFFESDEYDEQGFEEINYVLNETGSDTLHFKKEELGLLQKQAYRSFIIHRALSYIFHPWRLLRKIHSFEESRYILRLVTRGVRIFFRTLNPMNKKSSDYLYENTKTTVGET